MILTAEKIKKVFALDKQNIIALDDVSFQINEGEFFTLIGPSGCGKSTLLRIIGGLEKQTSGTLNFDKVVKIGFVFQHYGLFPFLSVFENIAFGLKMEGIEEKKIRQIVDELIEEVELVGFEDKHPKELSGGMKQRVGIARSLAISPDILLLDEPFSALDEFTAETLRKLLIRLWQKRKFTIILITHLIKEAGELSDRIAVMTAAPGKVETTIEDHLPRPRNPRSKEFYSLEDKLTQLIKPE
ncbi:ABC transporter ATP-binding protein [Candidatus Gottesmanbacteria bacterium]|nr:ABC transporter ATP-binding protein [Candidatus Gottesmanbacteria bacterium]